MASITGDGHGVELRTLVRKPGEGRWILSEAVPLKLPPLLDGSQLVHISWSSLGSDLIVVDAAGRVFIFTNGYALGRMQLTRASVVDQEDDLSGVVGMHWLPVFPLHQRVSFFVKISDDCHLCVLSVLAVSICVTQWKRLDI